MTTNRNEVRTFLKNWANTTSKPHFAVLIEGRWGCGKTHFIMSLLEDTTFTDRKPIYLSTFGIPDIQCLETSLFYASATKLTKTLHKSVGLAGSIFSGALTLGSSSIFGGTVNLNKVVNAATSQLEQSAKNMDGSLLILDDLERCQISMAELLGVVNRFVEHGDTRVVLLANTEGLEDENFSLFREKVVGHSFLLASDPEGALASFVAGIADISVQSVVQKYVAQIRGLYDRSQYHNLRALRQYVWHLASVIERMDQDYRDNKKLMENLVTQSYIFFVEFKLNLASDDTPLQPNDLWGEYDTKQSDVRHVYEFTLDDNEDPSPKRKVLTKYDQLNGISTVITVQQWISILSSGVVDGDWLNDEISKSDVVAGVASWRRIWHFHDWDFSDGLDADFWDDVKDVKSKLETGVYLDPRELLHVAGITLMLADFDLLGQTASETIDQLRKYIDDRFVPSLTYERYSLLREGFNTGHEGLGYMGSNDPDFLTVRDYLIDHMHRWYADWLSCDAGVQLLSFLPDQYIRFLGNLTVIDHSPEQRYLHVPILATINVSDFVDTWFDLPRHEERLLGGNLEDRYRRDPELLDKEGAWWRKVQQELLNRIISSQIKPRAVQIKHSVKNINSAIIDQWEVRQFKEFRERRTTDLSWMTRKRLECVAI